MLEHVIPFRYLTREQRESLRADVTEHEYGRGEVIIRQGDPDDRRVFLLASGEVEAVDLQRRPPKRLHTITAGHYFGERAALFEEVRSAEVRTLEPSIVGCISGERFIRLLAESTAFSQAFGKILRDKQGVFTPFDRFQTELLRAVGSGSVDLSRLVPFYRTLEPALHPLASRDGVDHGALMYAVRRLPQNVTRTLAFYLTETLPSLYVDPDRRFQPVATEARRRAVYEMIPGKNMVLIRDGLSDLVDLVTCLCLYAIEARKIRRQIRDKGGLDSVTEEDLEPLRDIWPTDTEARVRELALHHEDFRIEIHKELNNYNSAHAETWGSQIARATRDLIGCDPNDLPADWAVHIVSSNTHSVSNCLSPWLGPHVERILRWGEESGHALVEDEWRNRSDLAYALARDYLAAHPETAAERADVERSAGILSLAWTAFTGIAVQLIDTSRVDWGATDPDIPDTAPTRPSLIVNIDYAFGEQAEHIIANLSSLFGRNLASVNVLGKAGGLVGERGDLLVGTGFVEQMHDQYHPVPRGGDVDIARLARLIPDRGIHVGNLLTVTGTLLQNRKMLHFNKHIWGCVGLEMEGCYYLRHVMESMNRGAIRDDVALRFLYYVSDLPLRSDSNLSARLRSIEGVPPLYAITREILTGILWGAEVGR